MNSQFPSLNSPQRLGVATPVASNRAKIPLRPGHSLMDWIRLTRSGTDLRGVGPKMIEVTEEELAKHNTPNDAWMAIRGFVYNVTDYMSYHPGGKEELMRGVGMDATSLFNEIHNWVNFQSMLKACLVGKLVQGKSVNRFLNPTSNFLKPPMNAPLKLKPSNDAETIKHLKLSSAAQIKISTEWFQTDETISIACRGNAPLKEEDLVCDLDEHGLHLKGCVFKGNQVALIDIIFPNAVGSSIKVSLNQTRKTLDIAMQKIDDSSVWSSVQYGDKHCTTMDRKSYELFYRMCKVIGKTKVTHDTSLYRLALPPTCHMLIPIGHHVYLQADIEGITISRPYTAIMPLIPQSENFRREILLMIKAYQNGSLTPHLDSLKIGDQILVSTCEGSFSCDELKRHKDIVLFCGGTGFTPMVRVLSYCLFESDKRVKLFFYNKTSQDILWKDELDALVQQKPDRFLVQHILSQPEPAWSGKTGRISIEHIKEAFESNPSAAFACICGPPLYVKLTVELLHQFGVVEQNLHVFSS